MTWLPLWPFLCGRTKPVLDTAIRTLADQRPGHRLRVATGCNRGREWGRQDSNLEPTDYESAALTD